MTAPHFHITFSPPTKSNEHWANGFWALYQITGDQIAERTVFKEIVQHEIGPHYTGGVVARHSWCGYVGGYGSLEEVTAAIKAIVPN